MPVFGVPDNAGFEEKAPGLKVSEVITTPAGAQIRVVVLSQLSAAIVPDKLPVGVDEMQTIVTVPEGSDITTIAMSWSGFWDTVGDLIERGAKLIAGGCKTHVKQTATFDSNGVMTGFQVDYTLDCSSPA
jgi:hypothetical protein